MKVLNIVKFAPSFHQFKESMTKLSKSELGDLLLWSHWASF